MDYQVSARKYRPGAFRDVIGQPHVVQTLMNAISTKRIAHAFLFSGTRGVGKTTVARILAKALNCEQGPTSTPCDSCPNCLEISQGTSVDVVEIDGASSTGVDDIRELRENVKFTPFRGSYRVYIIDEVHMLSNSAFNALLKTLEEPPPHVVFIFATTEIHKIPATILSRCQHYNFRRIPRSEIVERLRHVARQDDLVVEDRSLAAIARASEGSMRDALSLLDQAVAYSGKTIRHDDLESLLGTIPQEQVRAMISAIIARDSAKALRLVAQLLDHGHDLRAYCGELVEYVRNLLVASIVSDANSLQGLHGLIDLSEEELHQVVADARFFTSDQLQELFRLFSQAEDTIRLSTRPRFVLEVASVRATRLLLAGTSPPPALIQATTEPRGNFPANDARKASQARSPKATPSTVPYTSSTDQREAHPLQNGGASGFAATPTMRSASSEQSDASRPSSSAQPANRLSGGSGPGQISVHPRPVSSHPSSSTHQAEPSFLWEQVVERIEHLHPNIGPFLAMGTLLGMEEDQITIGYPTTASVALDRIQKKETLQLVTDTCAQLTGRPVRLRLIEFQDEQTAGPNLAQLRAAKEQYHKHTLLERARSHPLVKQALEVFGADVVEVRPVPPEEEIRP